MATITSSPSLLRERTHVISEERAVTHAMKGAIVTGQIAGLITAVAFMLLYALFTEANPLYPIQVIGSFILGQEAVSQFSLSAVIVGVIIHQGIIALAMGLIYGAIARSFPITRYSTALAVGLGLGVVSMIGPYIIYPAIMVGAHGVDLWNGNIPIAFSWITYLIMGASFVLFPKIAEKMSEKDFQH